MPLVACGLAVGFLGEREMRRPRPTWIRTSQRQRRYRGPFRFTRIYLSMTLIYGGISGRQRAPPVLLLPMLRHGAASSSARNATWSASSATSTEYKVDAALDLNEQPASARRHLPAVASPPGSRLEPTLSGTSPG